MGAAEWVVEAGGKGEAVTTRATDKIADGLQDAVAIIERAKEIDSGAWRDRDHEANRQRRFEAIWKAGQELKNG